MERSWWEVLDVNIGAWSRRTIRNCADSIDALKDVNKLAKPSCYYLRYWGQEKH